MSKQLLAINNLFVYKNKKLILNNCSLSIQPGTINVLMGPNGAGKSSLANTILGYDSFLIKSGSITFCGRDVSDLKIYQRVRNGLFLAIQNPPVLEGVSVFSLLKESFKAVKGKDVSVYQLHSKLIDYCSILKIDVGFLDRYVNDGFSGGEKKKFALLQMLLLSPKLAILDEIDSGLDIDSVDLVYVAINLLKKENKNFSVLLITHSTSLVKKFPVQTVYVMKNGSIVKAGNKCLACQVEANGYDEF